MTTPLETLPPEPPSPPFPTDIERARLAVLAGRLADTRRALRFVDYREAERLCGRLAEALREALPAPPEECCYRAIPRGGLIVLGLLAYLLDLPRERLAAEDRDRPLVLVDDCALSGARLAAAVAASPQRRIVAAHLLSAPGLRRAVVEAEPRVAACVAADDLAPAGGAGADRDRSQALWRERLGPGRYWYGAVAPVAFAWSEPDHVLWNPERAAVEEGWRFLPPHLCLGNRNRLGLPPRPAAARTWQAPRDVAYALHDGVLWLCRTGSGEVFSLTGVGADLWCALAAWGDPAAAAELVREWYSAPPAEVDEEIARFLGELAGHRLLERAGPELPGGSAGSAGPGAAGS